MKAKVKTRRIDKEGVETNSQMSVSKNGHDSQDSEQKPKSKTRLFWEKYPEVGTIVDMRAVLK
jgi:hypothetical protein